MIKKEKIKTISLLILVGFLISVAYHNILGGWPFNLPYPFNSFVTAPSYRFSDYIRSYDFDSARDLTSIFVTKTLVGSTKMPISLFIKSIFTLPPLKVGLIFFLLTFIGFHLYNIYRNVKINEDWSYHDFIIISCLTYPFLMAIERANVEIILYIFICMFLYSYQKKKFLLSSIWLSLAIAMKLFPAIFILLFFSDKKYKEILHIIMFLIGWLFLPLFLFKGALSENISMIFTGLDQFREHYIIGYNGVHYGHSLWGAFKVVFYGLMDWIFNHENMSSWVANFLGRNVTDLNSVSVVHGVLKYLTLPYTAFVLMLTGCVTYYIKYKERELWIKVALLVFAMNLFPFVSNSHKMIYVYLPLLLFINSESGKRDKIFCILFALLMIPKHYVPLYWTPPYSLTGEIGDLQTWSEVLVDPLLMLVFAGVIIWDGIKMPKIKLSTIKNKVYG